MSTNHIELYGARTGNCLRVAIALEEACLPYRTIKLDLRQREHHTTKFLALNPSGKVPVIVERIEGDMALIVTQSNAIIFHVADAVPGVLFPVDGAQRRALAYERFFYFLTDVIAPSHAAFRIKVEDRKGAASSRLLEAGAIDALCAAEQFTRISEFMAGDIFTMADIAAVTIAFAFAHQINWKEFPALLRWYEKVMARPSVARGLMAFGAS